MAIVYDIFALCADGYRFVGLGLLNIVMKVQECDATGDAQRNSLPGPKNVFYSLM